VAFDLPPDRVSDALLKELYAAEGAVPTPDQRPAAIEAPGAPRRPVWS
jgi:hypothetical protein